jgi:tRNA A37 threonylcarbamoyladenosine synthetase subunit TsaC/SUA5/YrdC
LLRVSSPDDHARIEEIKQAISAHNLILHLSGAAAAATVAAERSGRTQVDRDHQTGEAAS